jgi:hypothetical protein
MDDPMKASTSGDLEMEWRLDAFAAVRLSPSARAAARMRARVMREVRLEFAARAAAPAPVTTVNEARSRRRSAVIRRGAGLLLAAALSLGVAGGAMAAAQAGGPLYPTRMWLETVTLPSGAAGHTDAEIVRLDSRMAEVLAGYSRGDGGAVAAALLAYQEIADEALAGAGDDAAALDRLRAALDRHLAVLGAVAAKVPPHASGAILQNIDRAIEHNAATVERMTGSRGSPPSKPAGSGSGPNASAKPDRTPKPTPDTAPAHTPRPQATPQPTPQPQATPDNEKPPKASPPAKPDKTPPGQGRTSAP